MTRRHFNGELLDIATASQLLGCSEKTLRARIARRLVPFRKFSGRIVFRRTELERFLANLVRSRNYICVEGLSFHRYKAVYTSLPRPLVERNITLQAGSRA